MSKNMLYIILFYWEHTCKMLPILFLFIASSVSAAPKIQQINSLVGRVFDGFDHGSINMNELNLATVLRELSAREGSEALAYGQTFAYAGEIGTGRPGDACAAANYIDAYTRYVASGNSLGVREALRGYIQDFIRNIDNFVGLVMDRDAVSHETGHFAGCPGEGRTYQFEDAWDIILGSAASNQLKLITEEYCVVKRLYCSLKAVSNNIGAQVTAATLPPTVQIFQLTRRELADFLERAAAKKNLVQSTATLKRALAAAVDRITL